MLYIILLYLLIVLLTASGFVYPRIYHNSSYKFLLFFIAIILSTIIAFRPEFFRDTGAYILEYNQVGWHHLQGFNLFSKDPVFIMEYGYILLTLLFKAIGFSYTSFFFTIVLFNLLTALKWLNEFAEYIYIKDELYTSFLIGFGVLLYYIESFYNLVAVRSGITFSLLMIVSMCLKKKRYILSGIWFVVTFSIQRLSALGLIPMAVILLLRYTVKKKLFIILWIIFGLLLFVQYRTNYLMNTLGFQMQVFYNSIMTTGITIGFDKLSNRSLTKALMYFGYWLNGIVFIYGYQENNNYSKFSIVYLASLFLGSIVCGFPPSYRIVDYLYIYTLPVNYMTLINGDKNQFTGKMLVFIVMIVFYVVWMKQYIEWFYYG